MIFLDNNSTTPVDERVLAVMQEHLRENYGNPHSSFHLPARNASNSVTIAREKISKFFGINNEGVILTSGATESNNQFITGAAIKAVHDKNKRKKIFYSSVEHKCVINSALFTKSLGFEPIEIPTDKMGQVDLNFLEKEIDDNTLLVSVMAVNNETGLTSPLKEIGKITVDNGSLFHSDFAQGLFRNWDTIYDYNLDAISISGHKIYGPKGIGALLFTSDPLEFVEPIIHGGQQEGGLRSGTVPVFLAAGLGEALDILSQEREEITKSLDNLKTIFLKKLSAVGIEYELNNEGADGHPGTLNIYFPECEAEMLCAQLAKTVAISSAAACNGLKNEYSYVLQNMGFSEARASSSIRMCFGKSNTEREAIIAAEKIAEKVTLLTDTSF
tara:strand:- start:1217 stop:2374 length:1158 start_codon:yes stop_codon:yes gene_type:complete